MKSQQLIRIGGIGASSAGALYNLDFSCARQEQYRLRFTPPDFTRVITPEMERGSYLEPILKIKYGDETNRLVHNAPRRLEDRMRIVASNPPAQITHPDHPWMQAHPDGYVWDDKLGWGIWEGKVLGFASLMTQKRQGLRQSYILQVQWELAITGYTWGSCGILSPDPWKLWHFDVLRDEEIIRHLIEDGEQLWKEVENGPLRDPLDPTDRRCHECLWRRTCHGTDQLPVAGMTQEEKDASIEEDFGLAPAVRDYLEAKQLVEEAGEVKENAHKVLEEALAGRSAVDSGNAKVYFREFSTERWETGGLNARMKTDPIFRALLGKYKKVSTQKPLKVYPR